jgi:hypothetical protein
LTFSTAKQEYSLLRVELPYSPNFSDYEQSCILHIDANREHKWATIEVQSHAIGSRFRGLIAFIIAFGRDHGDPMIASTQNFQVNYAESFESAERRFRPWLEESLVNALTLWRKSL